MRIAIIDESDDNAIAASIDAGVSSYVVDGLASHRIRPILDLAVRRYHAFARLEADLAEANGPSSPHRAPRIDPVLAKFAAHTPG